MTKKSLYRLLLLIPIIFLGLDCAPSIRYTRAKIFGEQPADDKSAEDKKQEQEQDETGPEQIRYATPDQLKKIAESYLGVPYQFGGMSKNGMDCSGFVTLVYREAYNKKLPRSSSRMWKLGAPAAISAARPGDLVFFRGNSFGTIDHVGIYMGNNRFIHASTTKGVMYSDLKDSYFSRRFAGIRRVI